VGCGDGGCCDRPGTGPNRDLAAQQASLIFNSCPSPGGRGHFRTTGYSRSVGPNDDLSMARQIEEHYAATDEQVRLDKPRGTVEFLRTMDIIARFLPPPPARILDVGGGPGRYALELQDAGYVVELVDALETHVAQAKAAGVNLAAVGDARKLKLADASVDVVLLLGPLYHLTERSDRLQAWTEAGRVVRPNGVVIGAAISRFASLIDGLNIGLLADPGFVAIVDEDLRTGQHRNPEHRDKWFTTAYFHHPDELSPEMTEAGLLPELVAAVEGPAQTVGPALDDWLSDPQLLETLLTFLARVETEPATIGSTGHLLAVGRRPPS
jgi:SAM-dependent methyltransferase